VDAGATACGVGRRWHRDQRAAGEPRQVQRDLRADGGPGPRPSFSAGPTKHLYRDPDTDAWEISSNSFEPFDPFDPHRRPGGCCAFIPAGVGYDQHAVPTGARVWLVQIDDSDRCAGRSIDWVEHEVTARELDAAAAVAEETKPATAAAKKESSDNDDDDSSDDDDDSSDEEETKPATAVKESSDSDDESSD
jgi:hypothetical protein